MSNKVTNIYIDTTGFCDEAMVRVNNALDIIVEHNGIEDIFPSKVSVFKDFYVVYFDSAGIWYRANRSPSTLGGKRNVGLWELESIALRCKKEKKEEPLPTRNIYIDARKLTQEERLNAYQAIGNIATRSRTGWLPDYLADDESHHEALVLFDIFAIDDDGDRLFCSEEYSQNFDSHLDGAKEITFDQLMSLTR